MHNNNSSLHNGPVAPCTGMTGDHLPPMSPDADTGLKVNRFTES